MKRIDLTDKLVLKIIALGLAIITWFYINGELHKSFWPQFNDNRPQSQTSK